VTISILEHGISFIVLVQHRLLYHACPEHYQKYASTPNDVQIRLQILAVGVAPSVAWIWRGFELELDVW
jgi:hypothetical protein